MPQATPACCSWLCCPAYACQELLRSSRSWTSSGKGRCRASEPWPRICCSWRRPGWKRRGQGLMKRRPSLTNRLHHGNLQRSASASSWSDCLIWASGWLTSIAAHVIFGCTPLQHGPRCPAGTEAQKRSILTMHKILPLIEE